MVDYIKPDGQRVMRTIADYRQLNDALFHAGVSSGSFSEWEDVPNRLHFYILDVKKNEEGILSYEIGVRSNDGSGPQKREFNVNPPSVKKIKGSAGYISFTVKNTGVPSATDPSLHFQNTIRWLTKDIYRLSVSVEGNECQAQLINGFLSLEPGETGEVPVYISFEKGSTRKAKINLTVQSESNSRLKITCPITIKIH